MWESLLSHPRGRLSTRKYITIATAFLVVCFAYIFIATPTALAADVEWRNDSIVYEGNTYTGPTISNGTESHNLPKDTQIYTYIEAAGAPNGGSTQKAHLIYFPSGVDPPAASTASYKTYSLSQSNQYSNPSATKEVSVAVVPENTTSPGTSSCEVENVGWLVCGGAGYLADGMDYLYGVLTQFLKTQPLSDGNNALYRTWIVMKDIANIAFIAGFLIIIYSYIVGGGFSAYSIKKILPRIIVAAILVNISFWVCAVAVDISNILGQSVQDLFISMRDQIAGTETNSSVGWGEMTGYVLSGGAIGTIGLIGATGGSIASAAFLLVGILITVVFAAFIAVIILAARQALIVILVIAAPLAFVAYLLPNTEKWFEKWRSTFLTMLMLFPIFSVIFGGSQFAGALIIQTAPNLAIMLLGMAVQVAPLVITPLLIKFSGGIIGQIAGMANNRSKGMVDGAKNWAKGNAELKKQKSLGTPNKRFNRANIARRTAQRMNRGRLYREGMTKNYQQQAENLFNDSRKGHNLHESHHWAEREKQRVEKAAEDHLSRKVLSDKGLLEREMKVRLTVDEAELSTAKLDAVQQELKSGRLDAFGDSSQSASLADLANHNEDATRAIALTAMRKQSAETQQKSQLTQELLANTLQIDNKNLRDYAGGIRGEAGSETMLSSAVASSREEYGKRISEKAQLIRHFNLSSSQRQELAMGEDVKADKDGVKYTFKKTDEYAREAAIDDQLKTGSFAEIKKIIDASGEYVDPATGLSVKGATFDYRTSISQVVAEKGLDGKALFWGTKSIDDIAQGKYFGPEAEKKAIIYNIREGKIKDERLASQDAGALRAIFEVVNDPSLFNDMSATERATFDTNYQRLRESAKRIATEPELNKLSSEAARKVFDTFKAP